MFILFHCNSWKYELGQLLTTYISSSDRNQTAFNKASGMMETREIGGVARQWEHWVKSWEKKGSFLDKIFMRGVKRKLRKYKRIRIKVVVGCGGGKDEVVNKSIAWCKWCKCFNWSIVLFEVLAFFYLHFLMFLLWLHDPRNRDCFVRPQ